MESYLSICPNEKIKRTLQRTTSTSYAQSSQESWSYYLVWRCYFYFSNKVQEPKLGSGDIEEWKYIS